MCTYIHTYTCVRTITPRDPSFLRAAVKRNAARKTSWRREREYRRYPCPSFAREPEVASRLRSIELHIVPVESRSIVSTVNAARNFQTRALSPARCRNSWRVNLMSKFTKLFQPHKWSYDNRDATVFWTCVFIYRSNRGELFTRTIDVDCELVSIENVFYFRLRLIRATGWMHAATHSYVDASLRQVIHNRLTHKL